MCRGQKLLIVAEERLIRDLFDTRDGAEFIHPVALAAAHLLQKAKICIVALVVDDAADGVDKVLLFALHIVAQKAAVARHGVEQQLAQKVAHWLKELLPAGNKCLVDEARGKADALVLALFAHRAADRRAVKQVERGGKRAHIRMRHRAAAQHARQQRPEARRFFVERRDELHAQRSCFEFIRPHIVEAHLRCDLASDRFHHRFLL